MTQPADPFQIFSRSCVVTVGGVQVPNIGLQAGLDIWFKVKRNLKSGTPNTCDLKLFNLDDSTRAAIESSATGSVGATKKGSATHPVPVQIQAGYVGNSSSIFAGQLRSAQTVLDHGDYVTELTTGDGDEATLLARSSSGFGPGTNAYIVAQQLIADMGGNIAGNIATVAAVLRSSPLYRSGTVAKGCSYELLQDLALSCGLEVSFQGGVLQWLSLGQPLGGQAYSLSSSTGLYESPNLDTKGVLNAKTAMLPGIAPGVSISLNAEFVQGSFRVTSVETTGDTRGADWSHSIEAKRFGLTGS